MIRPLLRVLAICGIICAVTNLSPDICRKVKEARREAGLSQSVLAAEVGCKQSALSMFEQGDGTKLNDEVIEKLCAKFKIELPKGKAEMPPAQTRPVVAALPFAKPQQPPRGFCPNALCPSHLSYEVEGRTLLKPDRQQQDPVGGKYCAVCGEILEKRCPNCGAPVHDGAVCSLCGEPYVPVA